MEINIMKFSAPNIELIIERSVQYYLSEFKQNGMHSTEAGGQLFGLIEGKKVSITLATGPYLADQRTKFTYKSCLNMAQKMIDFNLKIGLEYLGEWHTHPEINPKISFRDKQAMSNLLNKSTLRTDGLILVIVGNAMSNLFVNTWLFKQGSTIEIIALKRIH